MDTLVDTAPFVKKIKDHLNGSSVLKHVGSGCRRRAYSDGEWVFKFDIREDIKWGNKSEWENYQAWSQIPLPHPWAFPKMYYVEVDERPVIVAEYIPHEPWDEDDNIVYSKMNEFAELIESSDVYYGNVHFYQGLYYLIDMGS